MGGGEAVAECPFIVQRPSGMPNRRCADDHYHLSRWASPSRFLASRGGREEPLPPPARWTVAHPRRSCGMGRWANGRWEAKDGGDGNTACGGCERMRHEGATTAARRSHTARHGGRSRPGGSRRGGRTLSDIRPRVSRRSLSRAMWSPRLAVRAGKLSAIARLGERPVIAEPQRRPWGPRPSLPGMGMSVATNELGRPGLSPRGWGNGCRRSVFLATKAMGGWDALDSRDRRHARKPDCLSTRNVEKGLGAKLIWRRLRTRTKVSAAEILVGFIEGASSCAVPCRNHCQY